jgi:hypothetical protein
MNEPEYLTLSAPQPNGQLLLRLPNGISIDELSVQFPSNLSYENWLTFGYFLKFLRTSADYWRADWLKFGKAKYSPKVVAYAVDQLQLDLAQLKHSDLLNRLIERRIELSREHHFVIAKAKLDAVDQRRWIETSINEELTARELEESIRAGHVVKLYAEDYQRSGGFVSVQGVASQFKMLRKQIGDLHKKWTLDEIKSFRSYIAPIVEFDYELSELEAQSKS